MKCIDTKSNAFKVPLLIWLIAVLILVAVHPVKAESGSITASASSAVDYYVQDTNTATVNVNWSVMIVDNLDYTSISEVDESLQWTASLPSNTTGFSWKDINSSGYHYANGSSGRGIFSYRTGSCTSPCLNLSWVFTGGSGMSSKENWINISYDDFTVISQITPTIYGQTTSHPTQTVPAALGILWSSSQTTIISGLHAFSLRIYTGRSMTNFYNVTYPTPGFFQINITKSSSIATKDYVNTSSNIIYTKDTGFNTNPLTFFGNQLDGIYMNVTTATGLYSNVLINSSGITISPTPTPPAGGQFNPPLPIPSSGGSIQFNKTKYVVGDTVRVEWAISNTNWNSITAFELDVTHADGSDFVPGGVGVSSQSGSYSFIATKAETITATLKEGIIFRDIIATAQTSIVPEQPSTLLIPAVVAVGKPINFTYMYGFTPQSQAAGNGIFAIKDGFAKAFTGAGTSIVALTTYNANITFPEAGVYVVQLKDISRGVVAFTSVNATFSFVPPTQTISVSALSLDKSTYLLNDVIIADYAVNNINYSQYQVYYQVNNYGLGIIEDFGVVGSQTGQLYVDIAPNFAAGLSRFALRAKNNTADYEIIFQNFTVSKLNNRGFGMQITPPKICAGSKVTINLTIPEPARLEISETAIGGLFSFKTINLVNNTVVNFVPKYTETYTFDLIAASDNSSQIAYTVSPDCGAAAGATVTTTIQPANQASAKTTEVSNLLSSDVFWALIIISGLTIFIAKETRKKA